MTSTLGSKSRAVRIKPACRRVKFHQMYKSGKRINRSKRKKKRNTLYLFYEVNKRGKLSKLAPFYFLFCLSVVMLLLLPLLAGELLHIGYGVFFINDFSAEHRLYDVLHRNNAAEATVLVDDNRNVLFLGQ